jgi:hypothetical protein
VHARPEVLHCEADAAERLLRGVRHLDEVIPQTRSHNASASAMEARWVASKASERPGEKPSAVGGLPEMP